VYNGNLFFYSKKILQKIQSDPEKLKEMCNLSGQNLNEMNLKLVQYTLKQEGSFMIKFWIMNKVSLVFSAHV